MFESEKVNSSKAESKNVEFEKIKTSEKTESQKARSWILSSETDRVLEG